MKKRLISFCLILGSVTFLNANNLSVVQPNNYYTKADLNEAYNKLLAFEETDKLIEIIDTLLKNKKFKEYLYFEEMGKVQIDTITLLKQLKFYLAGWPKYSNTFFDNNGDLAGIKKILKDSIDNDSNFINLPQNVINDMKKSILNLMFFKIANNIEYDVSHKNLKNSQNLINIMKNLNMLINAYVNNFVRTNIPLLKIYNKKTKNELEKDYRIYIKTNLIRTMRIFKSLINKNYEAIKD